MSENLLEILDKSPRELHWIGSRSIDNRQVGVLMPNDLHYAIKTLSLVQKRTINEVMLEAVTDYLKKVLNEQVLETEQVPAYLLMK